MASARRALGDVGQVVVGHEQRLHARVRVHPHVRLEARATCSSAAASGSLRGTCALSIAVPGEG